MRLNRMIRRRSFRRPVRLISRGSLRASIITSRCPDLRLFELSTGPWKKQNTDAAKSVASEAAALSSSESVIDTAVDIGSAESIAGAARRAILEFGGLD